MQFRHGESAGGGTGSAVGGGKGAVAGEFNKVSSSLPFGQLVPLSAISGPTYVTAPLLVQQIAYQLSDKIFSYSPETFDLDLAAKHWAASKEKNVHGYPTTILPLQTRTGAGALAIGYIFSPDFDLSRRNLPQTLLAPTLALRHLRASLDQLSLLYGVASPFVAHVAAAEYTGGAETSGLVADYDAALQLTDELGMGLVASASAYEAHHMALFATLMAGILPTLHIYDGVRMARETLRVVDALSETEIGTAYAKLAKSVTRLNKRLDNAGKLVQLLQVFNDELGTSYELFEYYGHAAADTVLVVFGSAEAQLAKLVVTRLAATGVKVGAINVRVYRPFVEEDFLEALPNSVRQVAVLGQVKDETAVADASVTSTLHADVLTAISFSRKWRRDPLVVDAKYAASEALTPQFIADVFHRLVSKDGEAAPEFPSALPAQQYTFWDVDNSVTVNAPTVIGNVLSGKSTSNVYVHESYDNLHQGGIVRTDIRNARREIQAPFVVDEADAVYVGEEKLLSQVGVIAGIKEGGKLILRLPNFKKEDVEKRLPAALRKDILEKDIEVFALDTAYSPAIEKDPVFVTILTELAFLKAARPYVSGEEVAKLVQLEGHPVTLNECLDALYECFARIDVAPSWAEVPSDFVAPTLPPTIRANSFIPFDKDPTEPEPRLNSWHAAAKGLFFKEAYGTDTNLRPDLTVKTFKVHVKENRRLTPLTYDRNIFHIEFDLGTSGLTYKIGEALGVHQENDPAQVGDFITTYGLNADDLVQVPSRENPAVLETRTVYQSLMQNVDILGKPPKRFYEALAEFATNETEKKKLAALGGKEGSDEFKKRSEVDTITYVDVLEEFPSARPSLADLVRIVSPLKRREYSIASAQAVTPTTVALCVVVVDWVDPRGRTRYGQATRYLAGLRPGQPVTVSVKPSVMKLPTRDDAPLIMAGLGTGLAPFRAFVQYRAMQKAQGKEIGAILLYMGSRHQREEYLYGEEWEAYLASGVITLLGCAFSRDQPRKIYIQDRMRETMRDVVQAYIKDEGSFYLCGPTWPVPDVTKVLQEAIAWEARRSGRKVDPKKEIEKLKEEGRYVLEVY